MLHFYYDDGCAGCFSKIIDCPFFKDETSLLDAFACFLPYTIYTMWISEDISIFTYGSPNVVLTPEMTINDIKHNPDIKDNYVRIFINLDGSYNF